MKTILKISMVFLLFSLMGAGCQKNNGQFWEISPTSESTVIQNEVNGIEFKFCLLNEQSEPATVFKQGENFTFDFEFKNLTPDSIRFSLSFINDDFFRVKEGNTDFGKPWQNVLCEFVSLPEYFNLQQGETNILRIPWVITNNSEESIYPFCPSNQKEFLSIGNYYTRFELNFEYKFNNEIKRINGLQFKINFEIK